MLLGGFLDQWLQNRANVAKVGARLHRMEKAKKEFSKPQVE